MEADDEGTRFRAGLFYRLSACPVDLPLLRDHPEDICLYGPPRCNGLRRSHAQTSYSHLEWLHSGACQAFMALAQSGNCQTSIEFSVILTTGGSP
jgi:transcriptional regulator with GAF, ATPase, and Fis domain